MIEVYIYFQEEKKLSELEKQINLKELRVERSYDTADKLYYDDKLGIRYEVNELKKFWSSIMFYPSKTYSNFACEN